MTILQNILFNYKLTENFIKFYRNLAKAHKNEYIYHCWRRDKLSFTNFN